MSQNLNMLPRRTDDVSTHPFGTNLTRLFFDRIAIKTEEDDGRRKKIFHFTTMQVAADRRSVPHNYYHNNDDNMPIITAYCEAVVPQRPRSPSPSPSPSILRRSSSFVDTTTVPPPSSTRTTRPNPFHDPTTNSIDHHSHRSHQHRRDVVENESTKAAAEECKSKGWVYNSIRFLIFVTNVLAVFCSVFTVISCRFFSVDELPDDVKEYPIVNEIIQPPPQSQSNNNSTHSYYFGIFGHHVPTMMIVTEETTTSGDSSPIIEYVESCIPYEAQLWNSPIGPFLLLAQFTSLLAPCMGGMAFLVQIIPPAVTCGEKFSTTCISIVLFGFATLLQGSTFVLYGDTNFW